MPVFNLGTTPSNTVNSYYGPWSTDWAISSKHDTPTTAASGLRVTVDNSTDSSPTSVTGIGVTSVNFAIGSETTPNAAGFGRIWSSSGAHIARAQQADGSAYNVSSDSAEPISVRSYAFRDSANVNYPVILALGTTYRFGFHVTTGTANSRLNYDWDSTTGYNVEIDTNMTSAGSFSTASTPHSGAQLVGSITYYTFPEAPTVSTTTTTSSISVSVSAGSITNSGAVTGFLIQYKLSTDTTYTTYSSNAAAGSYTIPNLTPGKSYNIRVAARNAVSNEVTTASGEVITGVFTSASATVKTFGKKFTDNLGNSSGLSTIKRFIGIGQSGADADGYVNLTIGKRFDGTNWIDIG